MRMEARALTVLVATCILIPGCVGPRGEPAAARPIRAAVIGGVVETGLWAGLAERFERQTGHRVEVVASGPKRLIARAFREGQADLITMHSSDTIIHLVADGYALDPQPWLKNDLVIVGPPQDPASIKGLTDAGETLRRIIDSHSRFVVHASLGAQEVLRDILDAEQLSLDPQRMTVLFEDRSREVLRIAADERAYTIVGRIPFLDGKLANAGLDLMVRGDPRLRRPYLVAVADPRRVPGANLPAARQLAAFLRARETQEWIAEFGRGELDDEPIFFRVETHCGWPRNRLPPAQEREEVEGGETRPSGITGQTAGLFRTEGPSWPRGG